jgi:hypothetical protein
MKSKVRNWMRREVLNYLDDCNEINCTKLAEDAADEFNLYVDDPEEGTIPEWVFDMSFQVSCEVEPDERRGEPPMGTWAATARLMAANDDSGFDWDAWKDQMKERDR